MIEPSFSDMENVRRLMYEFFAFAAVEPTNWDGTVNDDVVNVFTNIYLDTVKCSKAMALVPRPPTGPASLFWLATQLGGAAFRRVSGKLNQTCAKTMIGKYASDLLMASKGIASLKALKWA